MEELVIVMLAYLSADIHRATILSQSFIAIVILELIHFSLHVVKAAISLSGEGYQCLTCRSLQSTHSEGGAATTVGTIMRTLFGARGITRVSTMAHRRLCLLLILIVY